jgi:hypothetical protein
MPDSKKGIDEKDNGANHENEQQNILHSLKIAPTTPQNRSGE